jgi:hypothetical protein
MEKSWRKKSPKWLKRRRHQNHCNFKAQTLISWRQTRGLHYSGNMENHRPQTHRNIREGTKRLDDGDGEKKRGREAEHSVSNL